MLKSIVSLFESSLSNDNDKESKSSRDHAIKLATAALLVEMARADFSEDAVEQLLVHDLLAKWFDLDIQETNLLFDNASEKADQTVSLHEFTKLLHDSLDQEEKQYVIEMLWRVAMADDHLDKYEDYLVRKIADLFYINSSTLARIRHKVLEDIKPSEIRK